MTIHGYELIGEWKNSQCGQIVLAVKGGKKYFLKKYYNFKMPLDDGSVDEKTFTYNKKLFHSFVEYRKRINQAIRPITGPGGNIIIPCDEFVEGIHYIEATEFVEDIVPEENMLSELKGISIEVKRLLMQTAAGALTAVHKKHIVHSDLKLANVLLVKNALGNHVAKLIDFDCSYFTDEKPKEIIGTLEYYSPEKGYYMGNSEDASEEDRKVMADRVAEKSDIFSLGIIFHQYLSGSFPEATCLTKRLQKKKDKKKMIYCWEALNDGCNLELSNRIKSEKYSSLISDMLRKEPSERPTALEVLQRLQEAEKVVVAMGSKSEKVSGGFCKPWKNHEIVFDIAAIKKAGYVSGKQEKRGSIQGYAFYKENGKCNFLKEDMLLAMKYAKRRAKEMPLGSDDFLSPWPEHHIAFDETAIRARGYVSASKETLNGVNGYRFIKEDGTTRFMREEMIVIQGLAKHV